eukprot:scaffold15215_cov103-Isochrysis_galbana.AAC.12
MSRGGRDASPRAPRSFGVLPQAVCCVRAWMRGCVRVGLQAQRALHTPFTPWRGSPAPEWHRAGCTQNRW